LEVVISGMESPEAAEAAFRREMTGMPCARAGESVEWLHFHSIGANLASCSSIRFQPGREKQFKACIRYAFGIWTDRSIAPVSADILKEAGKLRFNVSVTIQVRHSEGRVPARFLSSRFPRAAVYTSVSNTTSPMWSKTMSRTFPPGLSLARPEQASAIVPNF